MSCLRCFLLLALACSMALTVRAQDRQADSTQKALSFEKEIKVKVKLNYLLFLPQGYEKSTTPWPRPADAPIRDSQPPPHTDRATVG